jgi:hypothetical protein
MIDSHIDRASAPSSTVPVPERIPLRGSLRSVVADGYETCGVVMSKMALIFGAADLPAHHQCQPAPDNGKLAIVLLDMQPSLRVFAAKKALFVAAVTAVGFAARAAGLNDFSTLYVTDVEAIGRQDSFAISIARASALQQQKKDDLIEPEAYFDTIMQEMRPMKMTHLLE